MEEKNPRPVNGILILGAFYLLYMAYRLADTLRSGESSHPVLSVAGAALFALAGIGFLVREWRAWQAIRRNADKEKEP